MSTAAPVPPKRPGMVKLNVLTAPRDYTSDSISFQEGDLVYVLSSAGDQYKCKVGNKEGLVPKEILLDSPSIDFPLHEAAKRGNLPWLKELMTTGISVNTLDMAGNSPLFWACRCGHLECVKVLLAGRPVLNQQNKLGDSCLHGAAWGGHADVLSLLMTLEGIQEVVSLRNNEGKTALELAKTPECAAILMPTHYVNVSTSELRDDEDSD